MRECLWFLPDNTQHSSCVDLFPQMLALFSRNEASLWRQLAHKFHRNFHLIQPLRPAPRGACLHPHYSWPCVSTSKEKIFHEVHLSSLQADTASVNSAVRFWVTGTTLSHGVLHGSLNKVPVVRWWQRQGCRMASVKRDQKLPHVRHRQFQPAPQWIFKNGQNI